MGKIRNAGLALALTVTAFSATAAFPTAGPVQTPSAQAASCKKARVGGTTKCLRRGQFCAVRNQKDYRRAGFRCAWDGKGWNRLR